ncbi:MAG: inositol monophosphatase family protein [Actinomycetes bacterium]
MSVLDLDALLGAATSAALAGGELVLASFQSPVNVREKSPGDWVTDTDMQSERMVRTVLEELAPGIPVHGEEEGGERAHDLHWLVDPLDGTANFLHGHPAVGVSIGLVAEGRPVVGVVHAPMLGNTYSARLDGGATCNGRKISVSSREISRAIIGVGFPFRRKDLRTRYLEAFTSVQGEVEDLRRVGAASLDLCWTAAGVYDGYFELGLGPWDVAAGGVIVREAGGVVTDWHGDDSDWLQTGDIVVAPPAIHPELRRLIGDARS